MSQKQTYKPDYELVERLNEIMVNGHQVKSGMELTILSAGRPARYRFDWAEVDRHGRTTLSVYGPVRRSRCPHYRVFGMDAVKTVHVKAS